MKKLVSGAIGLTLQLNENESRIYFPNNSSLRGKRIKHISVLGSISDIYITLTEQNTQQNLIKSVPLDLLHFGNNPLFINKIIDLTYSYIDISQVPAYRRNKKIHFTFWYDEPNIWGTIPARNRTEIHPVEIQLTSQRTYFAENKDLKGKMFQNLLLSFPQFTPSGASVIEYYKADEMYLTLCKGNLEFIKNVPLRYFMQTEYDSQLRLQNIQFDFNKSYIETTTTTEDDLKSVFFNAVIDDNN